MKLTKSQILIIVAFISIYVINYIFDIINLFIYQKYSVRNANNHNQRRNHPRQNRDFIST